ncbi:interferon-induced protein with tetratricopeptide repeats 2-like [Antechinus flavipes]|uniref:interferon-induced protein with tetratricopeptide repeats 2-like n=1 Tax=Antechinus flavipes TaxID=38775 RepID=UPI002235BC21|nr:interferon-induced protein with tetratricopeptide repeats 2-like [Antechinus flavipes]
MSEAPKDSLEAALKQLSCPFTWHLFEEEPTLKNLEEKISNGLGFSCPQTGASGHNLLAYLKHLQGCDEEALSCLRRAEELTRQEHPGQADARNLVTWGSYAWLYYRLGRRKESRAYLDKVAQTCGRLASPYRIDCPEMDCEEGWARLKCGGPHAERAKACFERALERDPSRLELQVGRAVATCVQEEARAWKNQSPDLLRQALALDPGNDYLKVVLALKLQKMKDEAEGEKLVEEALAGAPSVGVLRLAAKFYRKRGSMDKALEVFKEVMERQPPTSSLYHQIGCCYRTLANQLLQQPKVAGTREKVLELRNLALEYLEKAVGESGCYPNMYSDLASMYAALGQQEKAEAIFQKVLRMGHLTDGEKQQLHQRYGSFQEIFRGQEDVAIHHYLEGVKIKEKSMEYEKIMSKLHELAAHQGDRKPSSLQGWRLLGFLAKQKEEEQLAMEHYEKALGILLQHFPSGIGSLFPVPPPPEAERVPGDQEANAADPDGGVSGPPSRGSPEGTDIALLREG